MRLFVAWLQASQSRHYGVRVIAKKQANILRTARWPQAYCRAWEAKELSYGIRCEKKAADLEMQVDYLDAPLCVIIRLLQCGLQCIQVWGHNSLLTSLDKPSYSAEYLGQFWSKWNISLHLRRWRSCVQSGRKAWLPQQGGLEESPG